MDNYWNKVWKDLSDGVKDTCMRELMTRKGHKGIPRCSICKTTLFLCIHHTSVEGPINGVLHRYKRYNDPEFAFYDENGNKTHYRVIAYHTNGLMPVVVHHPEHLEILCSKHNKEMNIYVYEKTLFQIWCEFFNKKKYLIHEWKYDETILYSELAPQLAFLGRKLWVIILTLEGHGRFSQNDEYILGELIDLKNELLRYDFE